MKRFLKKFDAYLVALAVFIALALAYCSPILKGKILYADDGITAAAAAQENVRHHAETGEKYNWTGSMFSGMPNYQIGAWDYKSDTFLSPLIRIARFGLTKPFWTILYYFICFFILLRAFKVNKWLSIVGSIAISLSSYFIVIIPAGHATKAATIALIAVVIAGFKYIFDKKYILGAILTTLFVAGGFSQHPQMFYYYFMMIGLLWIAELSIHIKEKRYKDLLLGTIIFIGSVGLGIGTGCSNVFANAEYTEQTMRGGHSDLVTEGSGDSENGLDIEYATQWSYGIDETMSFIIPGFKGGANAVDVGKDSYLYDALVKNGVAPRNAADFCANAPMYWGEQPFTAGNVYMGAIVCFLFVLGLLIVPGPYKWALLAATLFSTFLAWGHNFMWLTEFFFKYFPLYNKFRAVSSILIVAEVAMPLLGFMALRNMMNGTVEKTKLLRNIYIAGGITAGICLFFALFGSSLFSFTSANDSAASLPDWAYQAVLVQRASIMSSDSFRSFLFIAGAAFTVWLYAKAKIKNSWLIVILGVLVIADMWPVNKRYFNDNHFVNKNTISSNTFKMMPYEEMLLQDPDPHFRVMNITTSTFNDARTSYYLKSIGGYSAAKLRRYQDLIDVYLSKFNLKIIGMLNGKYIIAADSASGEPVPQLNPYALGAAWYVGELITAKNANEEMALLDQIDLSNTAVLDESFADYVTDFSPGKSEDATVSVTKYTPGTLDYTCYSSTPGTIVFSEIYYPYGWKAYIDGEPVEHYRVNYTLRAINVPAGQHEIHFEFDPDSVKKGDTIAIICILLMYLLLAAGIFWGIYSHIKKTKGHAEIHP